MGAMKWKKLGKIFDPAEYKLPNECVQFCVAAGLLVKIGGSEFSTEKELSENVRVVVSCVCWKDVHVREALRQGSVEVAAHNERFVGRNRVEEAV